MEVKRLLKENTDVNVLDEVCGTNSSWCVHMLWGVSFFLHV